MGYTPLGFILRGDRGLGTMGTTRGTGDDLNHIGICWLLAFRVHLKGGPGTGDNGDN